MSSAIYTMHELTTTKLYELPTHLYNLILEDIRTTLGILTKKLVHILNNAIITELDQYCNIYKYIYVIQ
jgi:hypothetical protein